MRRWALVAGGVGAYLLMWGLVVDRATGSLDRFGFELFGASRGSLAARVLNVVATVGPLAGFVVIGGGVAWLSWRREFRGAVALAVGIVLTLLIAHFLKGAVARVRPTGRLVTARGYSFPSAESAIAVGFFATVLAVRPKLAGLGLAATIITGLLVITVRAHYLTDVLAGWGLGTATFAAALAGVRR